MSDNGSGWRRVEKTLLDALATDTRLSGADFRALALALRSERNPGDPIALSIGYVSRGCGLGMRTAERSIQRLRDLGYLVRHGTDKKTFSATYTIATATPGQNDGTGQITGGVPVEMTGVTPGQNDGQRRQVQKTSMKTTRAADHDEAADRILAAYAAVKPARLDHSRSRAKGHLRKLLKAHSESDLLEAVRNYGAACDDAGTDPQYRRNAGNFFGRDGDFSGFLPGACEPAEPCDDFGPIKRHTPEQIAMLEELEAAIAAGGVGA